MSHQVLLRPISFGRWDFGFGCQFTRGTITPTVSLGLYIWGIPTLIGIGLLTYSL